MLQNPIGLRAPKGATLLHVGGLGERIHAMNPKTGRALCAPQNFNVRPAEGDKVTCYRCTHLMQLNTSLRGSPLDVGSAKKAVAMASERRKK